MSEEKICFVIAPIGDEGSDIREWSDQVLNYIIKPIAESEDFNYKVIRADEVPRPGMITNQVIQYILGINEYLAQHLDNYCYNRRIILCSN